MNGNDFDLDGTNFRDAYRLMTWREGKVMPGPAQFYMKGLQSEDQDFWLDVFLGRDKIEIVTDSGSNTLYWGTTFTPDADMTPTHVQFWAGAPTYYIPNVVATGSRSTYQVKIYEDNVGEPGATSQDWETDSTGAFVQFGIREYSIPFNGTVNLVNGTKYWIVFILSNGSGETISSGEGPYFSGSNIQLTADGVYSTDGSNWSASFKGVSFRLTENPTAPYRTFFFEHKGALHFIQSFDDGTNPKVFRVGDYGQATSGTTTTLTDTSKTWTVSEFVNARLILWHGTGSDLDLNYKTISANTADTITVSLAFDKAIDTSTQYSIINHDTVTEITGHGMVGIVTDVFSWGGIVYIMKGDDADIWHMYNGTFAREAGNAGSFMAAAPDSNGRMKLWLARQSYPPVVYKATPTFADGSMTPADLSFGSETMGGVEITDWDMEINDTTNWTAVNGATLAKNTSWQYDGARCMYVTTDAADEGFSRTVAVENGAIYKVEFLGQTYNTYGYFRFDVDGVTKFTSTVKSNTKGDYIPVVFYVTATSTSMLLEWLSEDNTSRWFIENLRVTKISNLNNVSWDEKITSLLAFTSNNERRCVAVTTGGIYREQNGDFYDRSPEQYFSTRDKRNGRTSMQHGVYMYLSFQNGGMERFFEGQLDDIGPNRNEGMLNEHKGEITDMVSYGDWILVAINGGVGKYSSILLYNGIGWHNFYRSSHSGKDITNLYIQPIPGPDPDLVWFSEGGEVANAEIELRPEQSTAFTYVPGGYLDTTRRYTGFKELDKYYDQLKVVIKGYDGDVRAAYIPDNYYYQGSIPNTAIAGKWSTGVSTAIDVDVKSDNMWFRVSIENPNTSYAPILESIVLDVIENLPPKWQFSMTVVLGDEDESLSGTPRHGRIETQIALLESAVDTPKPGLVYTPFSHVYGRRVKVNSVDWDPLMVSDEGQLEQAIVTIVMVDV
jgi:hypothetical protein